MRVVVTGSRNGSPLVQPALDDVHEKHSITHLVVGDQRGVDSQAERWFKEACKAGRMKEGARLSTLYVDDALPSPRRYHDRNERMVACCVTGDMCLAFPDQTSRGTWHTVGLARKAGLVVAVHFHERQKGER